MTIPTVVKRLYLMQVATLSPLNVPIVCSLLQTNDGKNILIDSGLPGHFQPSAGRPMPTLGKNVLEQLASLTLQPAQEDQRGNEVGIESKTGDDDGDDPQHEAHEKGLPPPPWLVVAIAEPIPFTRRIDGRYCHERSPQERWCDCIPRSSSRGVFARKFREVAHLETRLDVDHEL